MRVALCLVWFFRVVAAQEVSVSASVDSPRITIGDWLRLSVEVTYPPGVAVRWPALKDTLGPFDVIRIDTVAESRSSGATKEGRIITLSKYDSGSYTVPPIVIGFRTVDDSSYRFAQSSPISVDVATVAVDTSREIRDVKPPLSVPYSWQEIAAVAGITLAAAAVMYVAYWYYKKKRRKPTEAPEIEEFQVPPHLRALQRLNELEEKRLWQGGEVKAFYTEAAEIVREYFEQRYGIMALEMTTGEVIEQLNAFAPEPDVRNMIESFLMDADLVKFAKYLPLARENESVIPRAWDIVERTKPVEVISTNVESDVRQ